MTSNRLQQLKNQQIMNGRNNFVQHTLYEVIRLTTLDFFTRIDPDNGLKYAKEYITLSDSLQDQERNTRNKLARIESYNFV